MKTKLMFAFPARAGGRCARSFRANSFIGVLEGEHMARGGWWTNDRAAVWLLACRLKSTHQNDAGLLGAQAPADPPMDMDGDWLGRTSASASNGRAEHLAGDSAMRDPTYKAGAADATAAPVGGGCEDDDESLSPSWVRAVGAWWHAAPAGEPPAQKQRTSRAARTVADVDSDEEAEVRRLDGKQPGWQVGKQPIAQATGPRVKKRQAMHAAPAAASAAAPSAAPSDASREDLLTLGGASSSTLTETDRRPTRQRNVCAQDGCATFARRQSADSTCAKHGGGPRCEEPGCGKSARGDTGACVAHGPRCEFALYDCANGQSRRGAAPTMCIRHGGGLSSDELRERNEQRERQEELRAQQLVQMACGYGAPTTEQKAEAAALFNSMNPRLWPRQAVILAHAIAPDVATPKRQVSHHDLSSSSSPPNQSEEKSTREERSSPKFGFLNFVTDCALHGVSPRDRWLCVLPRWRINVNVSVNFVTNARSLAHRPPARVPWPPSRLSLSRHATCHGGRLSTDLGIAGSAGCAPLRNNGGLAENRLL